MEYYLIKAGKSGQKVYPRGAGVDALAISSPNSVFRYLCCEWAFESIRHEAAEDMQHQPWRRYAGLEPWRIERRKYETCGSHVEPRFVVRNTLAHHGSSQGRGHHSRFSTFQGSTILINLSGAVLMDTSGSTAAQLCLLLSNPCPTRSPLRFFPPARWRHQSTVTDYTTHAACSRVKTISHIVQISHPTQYPVHLRQGIVYSEIRRHGPNSTTILYWISTRIDI